MHKDNVDLICSIAELAGLFEKTSRLDDFLQTAVSIVAFHMKSAVCSVYLFDEEKQELVLTATQGLKREAVGQVRLKLGEGITGAALKELRPIRVGRAGGHPSFRFFPGIEEEQFEAFLAVPILRGLTRVGALVLQDPVPDYFDENDSKALLAIAAQLATTIENAKLLMTLDRLEVARQDRLDPLPDLKFLKVEAAAPGYAHGVVLTLSRTGLEEAYPVDQERPHTLADFEAALALTERQLEGLQCTMDEKMADVASLIFSAHLLMVKDDKFAGDIRRRVAAGETPVQAIVRVVRDFDRLFSESKNPRLREKALDVRDLGHRLLANLCPERKEDADYSGKILMAGELLPSDIVKLSAQSVAGLVLINGGVNSHLAIMARSLRIPMVIADQGALLNLPAGTPLLMDAEQGCLHIRPTAEVLERYKQLEEATAEVGQLAGPGAFVDQLADGTKVTILANINMLSEMALALAAGARGIGLYRSEFPFIVRSSFPSEEEQFRIYSRILQEMQGREVTFRTLDIGGDKMLSYFPSGGEANPFLGLRAIRFSLRYKPIFIQQLRALLRAGAGQELKIMFPLVSSLDDFMEARAIVEESIAALAAEGVPHNAQPRLGIMMELPSAVEIAEELAAAADFLSIGANDLVQYTLAVDRTNAHISHLYVPHHPAVLRSINRIAQAAKKSGRELSICGEMASQKYLLPFLLGVGITRFSLDARKIPHLYENLKNCRIHEAEKLARTVLALGRIDQIGRALGAPADA